MGNINFPQLKHLKWWFRVITYILCLLLGHTTASLLGRLYYNDGGNNKWMAKLVQSAGLPIILVLYFFLVKHAFSLSTRSPSRFRLILLYFGLGVILTIDNLMSSYGLLYLPVTTFSFLCAIQPALNAVSSDLINAQKFVVLIINSFILVISASLLAINGNGDYTSYYASRGKCLVGLLCTLGASAMYFSYLSVAQLSFERLMKSEPFKVVLDPRFYAIFVATIASLDGLFASREWMSLTEEIRVAYEQGRVSYMRTLYLTGIAWQVPSLGLLGLVIEVSSLFPNVVGNLVLPLVVAFAMVFFHGEVNTVKMIALVLAIWGVVSYIYEPYLDDVRANKAKKEIDATIEIC